MGHGDVFLLLVVLVFVAGLVALGFWLEKFQGDFADLFFVPYNKVKRFVLPATVKKNKKDGKKSPGRPRKPRKHQPLHHHVEHQQTDE